MENTLSYYALLGIFRDATQEEIKRAYFESAQRLHPDKNEAPGETEIFLDVQQAYEVLSNPEKRAKYDRSLAPEKEEASPLLQRIFYSRQSLVRLDETQLIYAFLEWKLHQNESEVVSPPLNISLVLDNSTSMKGQNIEMVKAATIHLIRSLRQQDILSVIVFNDRAEVLIPASLQYERHRMERKIHTFFPSGGTEIFQGLQAGVDEVRKNFSTERVNHIILLTDGQTYGDEEETLALAEEAANLGIGISGLGIGEDWNDEFLDNIAAKTGSSSGYIAEPQEIQMFLEEKFKQLAKIFAEKATLNFQTSPDVELNYIFRTQPNAILLPSENPLPLGMILRDQPLGILLEFKVKPKAVLKDNVDLLVGSLKFDIPSQSLASQPMRVRVFRDVTERASLQPPSPTLVQALANLNLYRMQERAQEEAELGQYDEASRRLQYLATHLLSKGERSIAKTVLLEAENLQQGHKFSEEGRKNMKYGTRALLLPAGKGAL